MSEKIGRNDPCYCGSGRKFKNCHLKIEQEQAKEDRAWESAARFLRRDLLAFAREERFAESFAAGIALFFNNYYTIETAAEMSEPEGLRFFDWFTYDATPDDRPRLIKVYYHEKAELMDEKERAVLDGWLTAEPACAYVLVDVTGEGKRTLHLENLFDGRVQVVNDSGGPGRAECGDVLIARLLPFRDEIRMSGATGYLPADEATGLKPFVNAAWEAYQNQQPGLDWGGFLRRHSHLFAHYELQAAKDAGRPPVARLDPTRPQSQAMRMLQQLRRRG
jgi:hypothetical protein